jgi:hypothetical protein
MPTTSAPVVITNVQSVDDAGGVQFESVWTARFLVNMVDTGLLQLTGNIRPDHNPDVRESAKTRQKIETWAEELLRNEAVIGNISVRLDPATSHHEVIKQEDGQMELLVNRGQFDCKVDSLSRIKAILKAARSPAGTFNPDTRFAVRIWVVDDNLGNKVASIYNTRGDKVNDTAAKYAWQATPDQRMAKMLMQQSKHLGLDNVEVLRNTVSASSHKLVAFNTLAQAMETFWTGEPLNPAEEQEQVKFLVDFWDALVTVRPEFGRLTTERRKALRGSSIAGTALSVYGLIAAANALYHQNINPALVLPPLQDTVPVDGEEVDYFSYDNPVWVRIGALTLAEDKDGSERKQLRMSFPSRRAIADELLRKLRVSKAAAQDAMF